MCTKLLRSNLSKLGLPNKSITIVGMLVQWVTRHNEIKRPANSRSHLGINTNVAPT